MILSMAAECRQQLWLFIWQSELRIQMLTVRVILWWDSMESAADQACITHIGDCYPDASSHKVGRFPLINWTQCKRPNISDAEANYNKDFTFWCFTADNF